MLRRTLLFAVILGLTAPTHADERDDLRRIEKSIREKQAVEAELARDAERLAAEARDIQQKMIAVGREAQKQERALLALDVRLAALTAEEEALRASLGQREADVARALMGLQMLALHPPDSLVSLRRGPTETVRGALLLRTAIPSIEAQAADLRRRLVRLRAVRTEIEANRTEQAALRESLLDERQRLGALAEEAARVRDRTAEELSEVRHSLEALAGQARDLEDLMARLRRAAPPAPALKPVIAAAPAPLRSVEKARGQLTQPVVGKVVQRYGEDLGYGSTSRGMTLEAEPGATVVAPFDGQIAFAGPFRAYGQILIIEHSDRYHTLLAGMGQTFAVVGQRVLAGEPVGAMAGPSDDPSRLYVELRRGGQPINPSPWLASLDSKESG